MVGPHLSNILDCHTIYPPTRTWLISWIAGSVDIRSLRCPFRRRTKEVLSWPLSFTVLISWVEADVFHCKSAPHTSSPPWFPSNNTHSIIASPNTRHHCPAHLSPSVITSTGYHQPINVKICYSSISGTCNQPSSSFSCLRLYQRPLGGS